MIRTAILPEPVPVPATEAFAVDAFVPEFEPPPQPWGQADPAAVEAADAAARHWIDPTPGALEPGTPAHAEALRAMFRDTCNPYRPAVIAWPRLTESERSRIVSLPIWDVAVRIEGRARMNMAAYAASIDDPALRDAIALNAWEESRHKEVLTRLVEAYGIALEPEPPYARPSDPEWAYMVTGYCECIDSFFAFGLFELARRSGLFPPRLVETFEPVMQDECRHILLFANWAAARRRRIGPLRRLAFELKVARVYLFLIAERLGLAGGLAGGRDRADTVSRFTVTRADAVTEEAFDLRTLLELSLSENARRFAGYDPRLRRPRTAPALARLALRLLPKRRAEAR
jgi:hypothetical protein